MEKVAIYWVKLVGLTILCVAIWGGILSTYVTSAQTDTTPPSAPTNLHATVVSNTKADISWNASTDDVAMGYYTVLWGLSTITITNPAGTIFDTGAPSYVFHHTGLTPSTTYYYKVKACDAVGNCTTSTTFTSVSLPLIAPPDLIMSALSTAASAGAPGGTIAVANTVTNQGDGAAGSFEIGFSLSTDTTYGNADDIALAPSRSIGSLASGASDAGSITLTIPGFVSAGSYYLFAVADVNNSVSELAKDNNTRSITLSVQVAAQTDLIMTDVTPNASVAVAGSTLSVSDTVANQGGASANANFRVGYVLSTDTVYSGDDVAIQTTRTVVHPFTAGDTNTATTNLSIPNTAPQGTYYLCATADSGSVVSESNETNNYLCSNTHVVVPPPDLSFSDIHLVTSSVTAGSYFRLGFTVANQGGSQAGNFASDFHLSSDAVYGNGDDVDLNQAFSLPSLGVGANYVKSSLNLVVAKGTSSGTYYVCGMTDAGSAVSESNEGNNSNCTSDTVTVR